MWSRRRDARDALGVNGALVDSLVCDPPCCHAISVADTRASSGYVIKRLQCMPPVIAPHSTQSQQPSIYQSTPALISTLDHQCTPKGKNLGIQVTECYAILQSRRRISTLTDDQKHKPVHDENLLVFFYTLLVWRTVYYVTTFFYGSRCTLNWIDAITDSIIITTVVVSLMLIGFLFYKKVSN